MVAATVHTTVRAIRDRQLSFMEKIIWLALPERREHGLGRKPVLEGHDTPINRTREGLLRRAQPLGGGDEQAVAPSLGLPEQRHAFDEVALGPETEDFELDDLSGNGVE